MDAVQDQLFVNGKAIVHFQGPTYDYFISLNTRL